MADEDLTDEEFAESQRIDEEYRARLAPASNEEIIQVAQSLWADSGLRAIFARVGYDGDLTEDEEEAIQAALASCRQGPLWDRDDLHIALAPPLLRQLAAAMIDSLDSPEAHAFLDSRKVERAGILVHTVPTTAKDVMDFAKYLRDEPKFWSLCYPRAESLDPITEEESEANLNAFLRAMSEYRWKRGYHNLDRAALTQARYLLWHVASGNIESLDCPEAWDLVRKGKFVTD